MKKLLVALMITAALAAVSVPVAAGPHDGFWPPAGQQTR